MDAAIVDGLRARTGAPPGSDRRPDFRQLLGRAAWEKLPAAVQARFALEAHRGEAVVYRGQMEVKASFGGRLFAHLCRIIGTPVAPFVGTAVPVSVRVFDSDAGVVWERRYEFPGRPAVTVRSTKQMGADGRLVEVLNFGLHMRLKVYEEHGALHFLSTGYFFRAGRLQFALPGWFLPGPTHVIHEDKGNGRFCFSMRTAHDWFGEMYFQEGLFE
jgi:hypothetical protein